MQKEREIVTAQPFMRDPNVRVEIASDNARLAALRAEWDALFESSAASPTLCPDWIETLLRHDHNGDDYFICAVRRGERLVAVVPLVAADAPPLGRMLRVVGQGWAPRLDLPVAADARGLPLAALIRDALREFSQGWQFCRLAKLPAGSPLLESAALPHTQGVRAGLECVRVGGSIVFELGGSMKEYLATVSHAHRSLISRRVNGMRRRCRVRCEWVCAGDRPGAGLVERMLQDAVAVARRSWQGKSPSGRAICDADVLPFVLDVSQRMAQRAMLDLSVLYADERPISFIWGVARPPVTSPIKLGFDDALKKESPGLVHLALYIEKMIERGMTLVDFGHEFPEYKRRWSKREDDLYDLYCYPRPLIGRLCRLAHAHFGVTTRAAAQSDVHADDPPPATPRLNEDRCG